MNDDCSTEIDLFRGRWVALCSCKWITVHTSYSDAADAARAHTA